MNLKKYKSPDRDQNWKRFARSSARRSPPASTTSTSTPPPWSIFDKTTLDEQQAVNCDLCAEFTKFIREHEPSGVTVSVGGEIGEVGGHNSNVHELHAFMRGYNKRVPVGPHLVGISKISVQTGTAHGGFVAPTAASAPM